ncbi:MAG: gamma-glutamyl-gamma-aminobutyrate hydrolase family protein [Phycisphaeraceae bacterium]
MRQLPSIGVTVDNKSNSADSGTYESAIRYSQAVEKAGGLPVLLPHCPGLAEAYLDRLDGLILTGGADPVMEQFGCATDGRARRIDQNRQAFELALLAEVDRRRDDSLTDSADLPVLGICLGMQLMALHHGATLDQYMPESMGDAAASVHVDNAEHTLTFDHHDSVLSPSDQPIVSSHRQRIADPGRLRVIARAEDGTIEAIDNPSRPFYLGVQWHPERKDSSEDDPLNLGLICKLIQAARR